MRNQQLHQLHNITNTNLAYTPQTSQPNTAIDKPPQMPVPGGDQTTANVQSRLPATASSLTDGSTTRPPRRVENNENKPQFRSIDRSENAST
ncbi:hypothetical protein KC19_10G108800 [Ceratodon purpureus]|uniref:Uncharacterized protein n=1 Tax=Ceratodon purpureus TaxID=3225 RepID=A0A8T0GLP9_CERPU|nr:hypothetical protein KC19_10G108800 [Ceratodon purpureus]